MERCGEKERCSVHVDGRFDMMEADPGNTMNTFALPCKHDLICICGSVNLCVRLYKMRRAHAYAVCEFSFTSIPCILWLCIVVPPVICITCT
jgi:hypothetical protein